MAGVSGAREGRYKATDAELDALAGNEDVKTSSVLDKVAKDAGYRSAPVGLRGDSKTYDELREEYGHLSHGIPTFGAIASKAVEAAEAAGAHLGPAGIIAPVTGTAFMVAEVHEAWQHGKELSNALAKDELRCALLTHLEVPSEFREGELAKYEHSGKGAQSGTMKMATWLAGPDKPLRAVLQLHCDQGMSAARDACDSRIGKDAYFQVHPEAAKRYADDAAYKAGFDAVLWAREKGDVDYKAVTDDLKARTGEYDHHHVAWRA